ncbi:MAG: LUD domain-containing protein, partial [Thermoplasmata archaeon]
FLEKMGYEVIETDLGDRIIQLANEHPAHPTGPACHLSRFDIAQLFSKHFGKECRAEPSELTMIMREEIDEYFKKSEIGITGANAIAVEEGAIVIVHNEGNVTRASLAPKKHIIIAGIDKFYPNLEEAINAIKLQTYYATGSIITAYVNIISSPSKTADIEKQLYKGMHGPSDIALILVDNGRSQATELAESLYCIGCGGCLLECPIYERVGNFMGYAGYLGGIGAVKASLISDKKSAESGLYACTLCGACTVNCPSKIGTYELVRKTRKRCAKNGIMHPAHRAMVKLIEEKGNIYGESSQVLPHEGENAEIGIYAGCVARFRERDALKSVFSLFEKLKIKYATLNERCCGGVLDDVGCENSEKNIEYNLGLAKNQGIKKLIAICPKCYLTLSNYKSLNKFGLEVMHISQYLSRNLISLSNLNMSNVSNGMMMNVTYHDPCDLGRHAGIYEEPREVIRKFANLLELPNSKENSRCCGAGGGVRGAFPNLSVKVARARCEEVASLAVDALLTDCPSCLHNLENSKPRKHNYRIMSIAQLLDSSI